MRQRFADELLTSHHHSDPFLPIFIIIRFQMNSLSSFFLFLRSVVKFVLHKITGQTQIQRISRRGDIPALQRSIQLSKMLVNYRQSHCDWSQPYSDDFSKQLCAIKNINNRDSVFRVETALKTLHSWKYAIYHIQKLRKTHYNSQSQENEKMLMEIWSLLRPNRKIKARKSEEWIEIGFQVDDPATDFRGAGVLGLLNLHGWASKEQGKEAFKIADTKGKDYFFASASLYLTMLSVQLLKGVQIGPQYWTPEQGKSVFQQFQILFEAVWSQFVQFWNNVEDKSMMQFNSNLQQFSRIVKQSKSSTINRKIMAHKQRVE